MQQTKGTSDVTEVTSKTQLMTNALDGPGLHRALNSAILAMTTNVEPTSELLTDIMVLRTLRDDIDAKMRSSEIGSDRLGGDIKWLHDRLSDLGISAEQAETEYKKAIKLAAAIGMSEDEFVAESAATFEARMRKAGLDPNDVRQKLFDAAESGDVESARIVMRAVAAAIDAAESGR